MTVPEAFDKVREARLKLWHLIVTAVGGAALSLLMVGWKAGTIKSEMDSEIRNAKQERQSMDARIDGMESGFGGLREDVRELKTDVKWIRDTLGKR